MPTPSRSSPLLQSPPAGADKHDAIDAPNAATVAADLARADWPSARVAGIEQWPLAASACESRLSRSTPRSCRLRQDGLCRTAGHRLCLEQDAGIAVSAAPPRAGRPRPLLRQHGSP